MKNLLTTLSAVSAVLVLALVAAIASQPTTHAQTDENQSNESSQTDTTEGEAGNNETYSFIAQAGDSYTQIARKAVQIFGIETETQIGESGVLYAETNLASAAGWPALNEGQTVTIAKTDVEEWFRKASQLTAEEKANWEYYIPLVDFNTNNIGEARKN